VVSFLLGRLAVKGVRYRGVTVLHPSLTPPQSDDHADPCGPARAVLMALALCIPFWGWVVYLLLV